MSALARQWREWVGDRQQRPLTAGGGPIATALADALAPPDLVAVPEEGSHAVALSDTGVGVIFDGQMLSRADGSVVGVLERRIDTEHRRAKHENFRLRDDWTGDGRGRLAFVSTIALYRRLGIEVVYTDAADVGRYAWAIAGFEYLNDEHRVDVLDSVRAMAAALGFELVDRTLIHPWHLAMLDHPVTAAAARAAQTYQGPGYSDLGVFADDALLPLGKALMLSGDCVPWTGILRLDGISDGYVRYQAYSQAAP